MDLEVVGRHALLFDDDAMASFVNSSDALVDWNSLLIDRYDVRHLLSSPPPPRRRHPHSPSPHASSIESELDHERFLDLPPPSDEKETDKGAKPDDAGVYHSVAFSYGNTDDSTDQKNSDDGQGNSCFRPPFPVPDSLLQSLPPTEKVHQIIARTSVFVSKHGGQSEIVLRVKQGDNPAFGFLMPDHYLHAYFRFLVDHQDLVQSSTDGKTETEKKGNKEGNQTDGIVSGALSLLGSVYGSGEDEDGADNDAEVEDAPESKEILSGKTVDASDRAVSVGLMKPDISRTMDGKNEALAKDSNVSKEKFQIPKRNSFTYAPKSGTTNSTKKRETSSLRSTAVDISLPSAVSNVSQTEQLILEPPSDMKKLVDKIVEFIARSGKQFEAVLLEQDSKHGRFPFLMPSNQYHPYYVKVLQKAQELKLSGKSFISEKDDSVMNGLDKKTRLSKGSDSLSSGSAGCDIPYDADRKEKFRMVLGKSKKDGQDPTSKTTQPQFGVTVDAAAAILQAASRGIKNPNFGFFSNSTSLNGDSHVQNSEGEIRKSGDYTAPSPVAKDIAKTAALEAANEADSSEAHLTKEQRLKAERLKRAKMFVAMLKSGAAPGETESLHGLSVEPLETGVSTSGNVGFDLAGKDKEGISVPLDANNSAEKEKSEKKYSAGYQERRSKRKYRSKSALDGGGLQEDVEDDEYSEHEVEQIVEEEKEKHRKKSRKKHRSHRSSREEGEEEEEDKEERDYRYARRRHRSHHSSRQESDDKRDHKNSRKKHQSNHSSEDDDEEQDYEDGRVSKHSRKKHRSRLSEDDEDDYEEERNQKHSRKKDKSHSSSRHHRDRHNKHKERRHRSSSKNKHGSSSDEEHLRRDSSNKHPKISHPEEELEEGEISSKMSDKSRGSVGAGVSREASLDVSSSYRDSRAPSQPSEATEVSDDLRAKIRAMLMANM